MLMHIHNTHTHAAYCVVHPCPHTTISQFLVSSIDEFIESDITRPARETDIVKTGIALLQVNER